MGRIVFAARPAAPFLRALSKIHPFALMTNRLSFNSPKAALQIRVLERANKSIP
tara:strand:- start:2726 stop:2887 length:162 start_codon:yes stop_codon:yes gene_type:complete